MLFEALLELIQEKRWEQLDEAGGLDPAIVVRGALENAVGVAGALLLAEAAMTEVEDDTAAATRAMDMPMMSAADPDASIRLLSREGSTSTTCATSRHRGALTGRCHAPLTSIGCSTS